MMSRFFTATTLLICTSAILLAAPKTTVTPGARTVVLAHNAYPDHGKYADRIDRAIASGTPVMIEEDLAWINGHSYIVHGAKMRRPMIQPLRRTSSRKSSLSWNRLYGMGTRGTGRS